MNWDNQLSSIISEADGSVAKIRERLATHRRFSRSREDLYPVRDKNAAVGFDPPTSTLMQADSALTRAVQWSDLAPIQAQLHSQSQAIECLTQNLRVVERERNAQQKQIQTLQEDVRRLEEKLSSRRTKRTKERALQWEGEKDPALARQLEQWKREMGRELSSLRGHISRTSSMGDQEESYSSKLCRKEVEQLSREVDMLKSKLMRQEEDVYQQRLDSRETKRQCERSCETVENITDSYHTHQLELAKIISQHQHTQQEVRDLRHTVSELKEKLKNLIFKTRLNTPERPRKSTPSVAAVAVETRPRRRLLSRSGREDDLSPTLSLGDVSSDDLETSWLGNSAPKVRNRRRNKRLSLSESDLSDAANGFRSNLSDMDGRLGCVSGSSPELSLSDL